MRENEIGEDRKREGDRRQQDWKERGKTAKMGNYIFEFVLLKRSIRIYCKYFQSHYVA